MRSTWEDAELPHYAASRFAIHALGESRRAHLLDLSGIRTNLSPPSKLHAARLRSGQARPNALRNTDALLQPCCSSHRRARLFPRRLNKSIGKATERVRRASSRHVAEL